MRIAVTYDNGLIFQHFGHTERFKVYDVENDRVSVATVVNTNGSGHGALADVLRKIGVDALICGGIGSGAKTALAEAKIALYGGVFGKADEAVEALLNGTLQYDSSAECEHRGHEHDKEHAGAGRGCGDGE